MFANTKILLKKAQQQHYAVGHFNVDNMETMQAVVQAAEKQRSPVILAVSEGAIKHAGLGYLYSLAQMAVHCQKVPIALHLDHGQDMELIKQCINLGFSSVMIDASHHPFEKNVQLTKQIVQLAHAKNVTVEAELGTIGGAEDNVKSRNILYTDVKKAQEFVKRTGCDALAVAIGTSHGAYKFAGKARLKIDLLKEIRKTINVPLVLHGASCVPKELIKQNQRYGAKLSGMEGVPDAQIKLAIKNGITKINTDTDLRLAFTAAVRKVLKTQPAEIDPRKMIGPARDLMQKVVEQRIRLFGSMGKA